jgi:phage gpG-like protein
VGLVRITIEAFGETELSRELLRFVGRADDMRPAFAAVRERFLKLEQEQFDSGGKYSGGWKPLNPAYVQAKERHGLEPNILVATGRLKKSLTQAGGDSVFETTRDSALFGSNVPYGVFHQSRQPRRHLPRRPPVEIPKHEKVEWIKILQHYLIRGTL